MDDERIRQLAEEVLGAVRGAPEEREKDASVEARLAALEAAVRRLETVRGGGATVVTAVEVSGPSSGRPLAHPALRVLDVPGGDERCVLEPDKPCEKSGRCRTFGY